MPIPGLKVLDELILGLPLNAHQRRQIEALKEQVAALEKENEELRRRVTQYAPKSALSPESLKILQFLFRNTSDEFIAEELARTFGMEVAVTKYHCDKLKDSGLVGGKWRPMGDGTYEDEYAISKEGRAYLIENRLTPP